MFDRLIVSKPSRGFAQALPGTVLSVLFHVVVIFAAVKATMKANELIGGPRVDTTVVFLGPEQPKTPPSPAVELPALEGFRTVVAPVTIPTEIPPIDLREKFKPEEYRGVGVELAPQEAPEAGVAYAEAIVEERPELISSPPVEYPGLLRQAGIAGEVLVEVVIDTTGRAEPKTLRIVRSSHPAFEQPAKDVVLKSVFRPGRVGGRPVRVLVDLPVSFSIRRPVA
ncbi:MAG: TonB family protein [Gemmatimonadetes bacterium]|nr:TonB family protein [Gemmatimonadota bacterium]